jgi:hypothetical protein
MIQGENHLRAINKSLNMTDKKINMKEINMKEINAYGV